MHIKLLFFATLREGTGKTSLELDVPKGTTVRALKEILIEKFPALAPMMPSTLVSINREFAEDEAILPDGGEIALFPPVAGG